MTWSRFLITAVANSPTLNTYFLSDIWKRLAHKTASSYPHVVYVDGFAGPWQSANEKFEDTSFGIALNALRQAKASWRERNRNVKMSAFLVERDPAAYKQLAQVPAKYPDIEIKTYQEDFFTVLAGILRDIPADAFAFFLIDPKGWRIPLRTLAPLLARPHSEVIFNFMFDFINRAASIKDPAVVAGLDELIPVGNWRSTLEMAENAHSGGVRKSARPFSLTPSLPTLLISESMNMWQRQRCCVPLRIALCTASFTQHVIPVGLRYFAIARPKR